MVSASSVTSLMFVVAVMVVLDDDSSVALFDEPLKTRCWACGHDTVDIMTVLNRCVGRAVALPTAECNGELGDACASCVRLDIGPGDVAACTTCIRCPEVIDSNVDWAVVHMATNTATSCVDLC